MSRDSDGEATCCLPSQSWCAIEDVSEPVIPIYKTRWHSHLDVTFSGALERISALRFSRRLTEDQLVLRYPLGGLRSVEILQTIEIGRDKALSTMSGKRADICNTQSPQQPYQNSM